MGAAVALYNHRAMEHLVESASPLNLKLPQSERNRRGNAYTSPKNNSTATATLTREQVSGPGRSGMASVPAVGVEVVGNADV